MASLLIIKHHGRMYSSPFLIWKVPGSNISRQTFLTEVLRVLFQSFPYFPIYYSLTIIRFYAKSSKILRQSLKYKQINKFLGWNRPIGLIPLYARHWNLTPEIEARVSVIVPRKVFIILSSKPGRIVSEFIFTLWNGQHSTRTSKSKIICMLNGTSSLSRNDTPFVSFWLPRTQLFYMFVFLLLVLKVMCERMYTFR
jgi:hypothetical protein